MRPLDAYRLIEPNKAILVIGEVDKGDETDKKGGELKITPQEIIPLEDAPRKFTKQVHFRLHTAHLKPENLDSIRELIAAHPGNCPLFLCFMRPAGQVVFIQPHERFAVMPSRELQQAADAQFGEETYYVKVDTSLPERQRRNWEKKSDTGNGED